jgi:acetoin utilization deacetylase AcuC-like enzyme
MNNGRQNVICTYCEAPHHRFRGHPESPERIHGLRDWLTQPPYPEMSWLEFRPASEKDVSLIHTQAHLEFLRNECQRGSHQFESSPSYVTGSSYEDALSAVGGTLAVSRKITASDSGRGFAIVRPPGHHATGTQSMGFCLLNNIAIAAADAIASGLTQVAILDFDAHHGNGTEAIFWETPEVGYLSTHEGGIYPGGGQVTSASHARGRIVNIPLPSFSGNKSLKLLTDQVFKPWLEKINPDMLFVSAGYDGHFSDPLTTLTLDTQGYFQLVSDLVQLAEAYCQGRILLVLEGGYDPIAMKDNIQASLAALSGRRDFDDHYGKSPGDQRDIQPLITYIRQIHYL